MLAAEEIAKGIAPWPPPGGHAPVADLVLACYPPQERELAELELIFAPDAVITMPPFAEPAAFRHYFGFSGVVDAFADWRPMLSSMDVVPEGWVVAGRHMVVVCRVERDGHEPTYGGWLCTERDGRLQTMRGFRYVSEALERLAALAGESPGD